MINRYIRFFICSRDRPNELEKCIKSLAKVLLSFYPKSMIVGYIFDDSTSTKISSSICNMLSRLKILGFNIYQIGYKEQKNILKNVSDISKELLFFFKKNIKRLGSGYWDLAGVRNFAFLFAYCCSNKNDFLLFLDDDIRFESGFYYKKFIPIKGKEAITTLYKKTIPCKILASGVGYYGGADRSAFDNMKIFLDKLELAQNNKSKQKLNDLFEDIRFLPNLFPVKINLPSKNQSESGPGISGAVLATTPISIRSHAFPRCYNEDWIWLSLLGDSKRYICRIEPKLLHAEPYKENISSKTFIYQLIGDINYIAMKQVVKNIPSGISYIEWCKSQINQSHFNWGKKEIYEELLNAINKTKEIKRSIDNLDNILNNQLDNIKKKLNIILEQLEYSINYIKKQKSELLYNQFRIYLNCIPQWQILIDNTRKIFLEKKLYMDK